MKAPAFDYLRPATIAEAVAALAEGAGGARILAGGQSLVPMLNLRVAFAETLIDIGAIADLRAVVDEGETVLIGAGVTHATLEDGTIGDHWRGMPAFVARDIAYRAVRNRGTLGGSLCHADPAADWPVAMMALGATMLLAGPDGERALAAKDFSVDVFTTALEEDEMLTGIRLPKLSPSARWSYRKMRKKAGAFGEAIAAVVHDPARGFTRVVAGSSAVGGPCRLEALEGAVALGSLAAEAAIRTALAEREPDLDRYGMQIHATCLRRAMKEVSS